MFCCQTASGDRMISHQQLKAHVITVQTGKSEQIRMGLCGSPNSLAAQHQLYDIEWQSGSTKSAHALVQQRLCTETPKQIGMMQPLWIGV